jgi:hypothetical protein
MFRRGDFQSGVDSSRHEIPQGGKPLPEGAPQVIRGSRRDAGDPETAHPNVADRRLAGRGWMD